jgi:hypothetical protein
VPAAGSGRRRAARTRLPGYRPAWT